MRKRSRIQNLSLCVGALALTGFAGQSLAQSVSGNLATTGVNYGTPAPGTAALTTQTINTGFGNSTFTGTDGNGTPDANGSELDAAYGTVSNGFLYLFLSGNLENNGNMLDVFIDDGRAGGQNTLNAPQGAGTLQNMNGSIFSPNFNATYALEMNDYGPNSTAYLDSFNLLPGGTGSYLGSVGLSHGVGSTQSIGTSKVKLAINNTNISTMGVSGTATSATAAQSVSTGIEFGIPLSLLGNPTGNIEVMADINQNSDTGLSNQFLPGLPVGTQNLKDGTETYSGSTVNTGTFNLSTLSNFWFTVPNSVVANGIWLPDASGSWNTASNWSNSYIPHVAGDSASFSDASASATVTLDGSKTVGNISFNSSGSYTINQGSGGSLTLDNGGATATANVIDYVGNHTLNVPIILNSNASISVLSNGSNLTISGNITGAGSLTTASLGENGRTNTTSAVILSGNNSYSGGTTIQTGILQLGSATALPANTSLTMDATDSPEATFDLNGFNATLIGLTTNTGSGGNTQIINSSATANTATLTFAGTGSTTYPGNITDSYSTGGSSTALTVSSGSLTLTGANTYAGTTTVAKGATLAFSTTTPATPAGTTFPSTGNVNNNGSLVLNDSVTAGTISGSGTTTITANQMVNVTTLSQAGGVDNEGSLIVLAGGTGGAITETGTAGGLALYGGTLQIAPNSAASIQSVLYVAAGALDITNNRFFINYGPTGSDPISQIVQWIQSGAYGGGTTITWTGTGIISSTAQTNPNYGIGYADYADPGNPAGLSSGQIEMMYTLLGDANLDGKVNGTDFNLMAANFNQSVTNGWDEGDFNYDGKVNGNDFVLLASNFNQFASGASPADVAALDAFAAANGISLTSVPEPATMGLLAVAGLGMLRRRRRSS
jgi:autotransporter-associated beta strand protein